MTWGNKFERNNNSNTTNGKEVTRCRILTLPIRTLYHIEHVVFVVCILYTHSNIYWNVIIWKLKWLFCYFLSKSDYNDFYLAFGLWYTFRPLMLCIKCVIDFIEPVCGTEFESIVQFTLRSPYRILKITEFIWNLFHSLEIICEGGHYSAWKACIW